jgi:hypothetical protein
MTSRAERYRELARECLRLANLLPPGLQRDRVIEMAHERVRLAELQDGCKTALDGLIASVPATLPPHPNWTAIWRA